jgi:multicomponent Na+:H+ antiporter subunit D
MRAVVVGTTELYAAVDRTAVAATDRVGDTLKNPGATLERFTSRESVQTRTDIGTSVALVTLVIVSVLVLMFMS